MRDREIFKSHIRCLKEVKQCDTVSFVMVFESGDVSRSLVGRCESPRYLNAEASDRSLSYVDLRFGRKIITEDRKVFESVRRFGKPRQQCSDVFAFMKTEEKDSFRKEYANEPGVAKTKTFHTLKNIVNKDFVCGENNECYVPDFEGTPIIKIPMSVGYDPEGFENNMHRWSENYREKTYEESRRSARSSVGEGTACISKDMDPAYFERDAEAQIQPRCKRQVKRSEGSEVYYGIRSCESGYSVDEDQARVADIRENWRLRILREDEERLRLEESRKRTSRFRQSPVVLRGEVTELHRSKSTPDMVDGVGRRTEEEWLEEENRKINTSLIDVSPKNWAGECDYSSSVSSTASSLLSDTEEVTALIYRRVVYNEHQEADSLNDPTTLNEPVSSPSPLGTTKLQKSGKNFFGHFMTSRGTTPTIDMLDYKEPFSQFWMVLSTLYGQALIILILAFCLTEVMDNPVKLLSLQGVFLMYLYVGSIGVIICIYIWVLVDSCSSLNTSSGFVPPTITTSIVPDKERELRDMSVTKFGSLKKAHISRDRTSSTSFYLRIGAIAFGLGTLVFNGLEMAMHSMMEGSCLNDVVFVHPILHGLFTFLQMHFLFVNSQVLVEKFGLAARFGFMHLTATNLALWIRLIIWESGNEWTYFVHLSQNSRLFEHPSSEIPTPLQLRGFPKFVTRKERDVSLSGEIGSETYQPISYDHISQVVSLHHCLNTNSLGQLWTSSMPFLYPFIIQFSLIAAAVTFVMGQNVAKDRLFFQKQKKSGLMVSKSGTLPTMYDNLSSWGVDCNKASKGLFLGLLCLVAGVVVIIIFLVVKEDEDFPADTVFWLTYGTLLTIVSVTILMNVAGLVQIRKLSVIGRKMTKLDSILSVISMLGVQLYTTFSILVGAVGLVLDDSPQAEGYFLTSNQKRHAMLLSLSVAQLIQATMQSSLISEGIRRTSLTRSQILTKPARQTITFLLFSNSVLWAFDTFVLQSWMSQELQLRFFGVLVWGVISRIGLPLLVFFRFHSCVLLLEIWKRSYQSLHIEPGN